MLAIKDKENRMETYGECFDSNKAHASVSIKFMELDKSLFLDIKRNYI